MTRLPTWQPRTCRIGIGMPTRLPSRTKRDPRSTGSIEATGLRHDSHSDSGLKPAMAKWTGARARGRGTCRRITVEIERLQQAVACTTNTVS